MNIQLNVLIFTLVTTSAVNAAEQQSLSHFYRNDGYVSGSEYSEQADNRAMQLVEHGADLCQENLFDAASRCHIKTIEALLRKGCDVNYAREVHYADRPTVLLPLLNFTASNTTGRASSMIDLLVSRGADKESRSEDGCTPFLRAALYLSATSLECLLRHEVNTQARDVHGNTALHLVFDRFVDHKTMRVLPIILQRTAPEFLNVENNERLTVLDRAINLSKSFRMDVGRRSCLDAIKILLEAGCRPTDRIKSEFMNAQQALAQQNEPIAQRYVALFAAADQKDLAEQ